MIQPYENIEIYDEGFFTEETLSFSLKTNPSPKIILLRGMTGSIGIKHTLSQTEFIQTTDYLDLGGANIHLTLFQKLKNYISDEITIDELNKIFLNRRFQYQNKSFFDGLIQEFNNFYYYENKQSYTTAFTFVYRILEKISYAFPLIYAAKTDDFKGTYDLLKKHLSGTDVGELGFFKKFIGVVFKDDPMLENSIDVDVIGDSEQIQQSFYNSFKKACPNANVYHGDTIEPSKLSIKFPEFPSFIISLRNRFFHLLNTGQPNLESDDILDADHLFSLVNKKSISWISLVLFEIIKFNIAKENK